MTTLRTGKRILITGPKASEKTTRAASLVDEYRRAGKSAAGVLSLHEFPDDPHREVYRFRFLSSGEARVFARRSTQPTPPSRRYRFLEEAFASARGELTSPQADLVIVDECGPLEMEGDGFWEQIQALWASFSGDLAVVVRETLLERLLSALESSTPRGAPDEIIRPSAPE